MTNAASKQQQRSPAKTYTKASTSAPNASQFEPSEIDSIATDIFVDRNSPQLNTLNLVKVSSVQRARQLRKDDFDLFKKFHEFFTNKGAEIVRVIDSKSGAKREQVDSWVRSAASAKVIACITSRKESQQSLLALLVVASALSQYGERELIRKYSGGEMEVPISPRFRGAPSQLKQQSKTRAVIRKTTLSTKANAQHKTQKAPIEVNSTDQLKDTRQGAQMQTPPPAPVTAKSSKITKAQTQSQKKSPTKNVNQQTAPVQSGPQTEKNATPAKNVSAAWAGPLRATGLQSGPDAIVSSAPGRASVTRAHRA